MIAILRKTTCLLMGIFVSSCCSNLYYVNDPVITANVTKKADLNIAGGLNAGNVTSGGHFHGSVAVSNNLFISSAFSNYSGGCTDISTVNGVTTDNSIKYSGQSFLLGGGYYKALGKGFYFEGSIGGKYGKNHNKKSIEDFEYRHVKYIFQPGITFTSDYFQAGLAFRFGMIDYLPFKTGSQHIIPEIATKSAIPYVDPAIYFCGGGKYVKVGCQLSYTIADNSTIAYDPLGIFFGGIKSDPLSVSLFIKITVPSKKINN